jgi:DNA topoisomerase IB
MVTAIMGLRRSNMPCRASARRVASKYKNKKEVPKADGSGTTTVYEYSPRQVAQRHKQKAVRIESLRKKMSGLRKQALSDLTASDPQTRLTALAVCLMDETYERVGNERSAKEGHHGVTNWTADHITLGGKVATIKYTGKSGVKHEKKVTNARVLSALRKAMKGKGNGDKVLCDGDECSILAQDVNAYLKPYKITAKDIRGLHANEEMKRHLKAQRKAGPADLPRSRKERDTILKAEFKAALDLAAEAVGHEASTLRSQYLVPNMEDAYVHDGTVLDKLDKKATLSDSEKDEREAERLVKKSPKKKPPRLDRERRVVQDRDNSRDPDDVKNDKDTSNRSRDAAASCVALRHLSAKGAPGKIPMYSTEAKRIVTVTPETAKAESGKYKEPTEEQLSALQSKGDGPEGESSDDTPDPKTVTRKKQKEDAKKGGAVSAARAKIEKLSEGNPKAWDRDALQAAVKEEFDALGLEYTDDDLDILTVTDERKEVQDAIDSVKGSRANSGTVEGFEKAQKELRTGALDGIKAVVGSPSFKADDLSAEVLLDIAEAVGADKGRLTDDLTSGGRKAVQSRAKAAEKVLAAIGSEKPPSAAEIAGALLAKKSSEMLGDPTLLDPSKPLTSYSTEALGGDKLKSDDFLRRMVGKTNQFVESYRGMASEGRATHAEGLMELMGALESSGKGDSEQHAVAKAQARALGVVSALEDGDEAKGVTPEFQAMLKAADSQGRLEDFVALNFTGQPESDVGAQTMYREIMRDLPVSQLASFMDDGNPFKEVLQESQKLFAPPDEAGEADWSSVIDAEGKDMLRQDMEDMILAGISFTDMDEVRKGGKTTKQQRKDKKPVKAQENIASKIGDFLAEMRRKMEEAMAGSKKASSLVDVYDFAPWGSDFSRSL